MFTLENDLSEFAVYISSRKLNCRVIVHVINHLARYNRLLNTMAPKVAIVTGSNKGIGFAIVRGLCKTFDGDVFLTSRNEERGFEAVSKLEKEGLKPKFHQLDLEDKASISKLAGYLKENYGGIDILVNNAAIAFKAKDPTPFATQAKVTMKTNYHALLDVCDSLFPLLKEHARVVHVASMVSVFAYKGLSESKQKAARDAKGVEGVTAFMEQFVKDTEQGDHKLMGWPNSAYGMTKLGVVMVTEKQQVLLDQQYQGQDVVINCCCPGLVDTDMSSHKGSLTPDQGAVVPLYLAQLPASGSKKAENVPKGKFFQKKGTINIVDWTTATPSF